MQVDKKAFVGIYLDETEENIRLVENSIITLKKDPENQEELNKILRALHTIKGSSSMLEFPNMQKISHGLEDVFKGVREKRIAIDNNLIQLVFVTLDFLRNGISIIKEKLEDTFPIDGLLDKFKKACSNEPYNLDDLKAKEDTSLVKKETGEISQATPTESQPPQTTTTTAKTYHETIRVKVDKIDKIVKLLHDLIIKQFQLKKDYETLSQIEDRFEQFVLNIAVQKDKNSKIVESLEKKGGLLKDFQKIKKDFWDHFLLIERNTFELQNEIYDLRMLPLELILGSLPKMVEETAIRLGKQIDFNISGMDVKLDKLVLEKINDPIIHLVRNSIDHGIESPEERERKGKSRTGKLKIECYSEGRSSIIKIRDDGKGLDYDKIRKRAIELYPSKEEEIKMMNDTDLLSFIFLPGFSTKSEVSDLSGRGVGLDVVKYNIEKIKGRISVYTEKDKGTEFTLILPLSLATADGFFVISSGRKFFITSNFVKEIIIFGDIKIIDLLGKKVFKLREKIVPIYDLADIIPAEGKSKGEKNFVVVIESFGEMVGVIVDSIIEYSSLIFRPLPKNLQNLHTIQGIVFDENYNIVNILHIPAIIQKFKGYKFREIKTEATDKKRESKSILVVDDSLSTREIEKSILELGNYNVTTAVDGIDGLEKVKTAKFDLIITDIKMPRMDGFTFIENLKKDENYSKIPIVVVSNTMDNQEYIDRSQALGVDAYIVKSMFNRDNLLNVVGGIIGKVE